eukprot:2529601-Karenia_brevis.AAC.1
MASVGTRVSGEEGSSGGVPAAASTARIAVEAAGADGDGSSGKDSPGLADTKAKSSEVMERGVGVFEFLLRFLAEGVCSVCIKAGGSSCNCETAAAFGSMLFAAGFFKTDAGLFLTEATRWALTGVNGWAGSDCSTSIMLSSSGIGASSIAG